MVLLLQSLILGNEKLQMIAAFQSEEWEAKNKKKLMSCGEASLYMDQCTSC